MKRYFFLLVLLSIKLQGHVLQIPKLEIANPNLHPYNLQLNPNVTPPVSNNPNEPAGKPANYKIGHNNDFSVQVKIGGALSLLPWQDLFVYNTFVDNTSINYSSNINSSFVSFAFSEMVTIKVTSLNITNIESVIIRPISRGIQKTISGNTITFTITNPDKFSLEINGDRYRNLQIFANDLISPTQSPYNNDNYTLICEPNGGTNSDGIYIYQQSLNTQSKKIRIKAGAILIVPYSGLIYSKTNGNIEAQNGDEFYIEEGGVLKGGIMIENKSNVKVYGRGMIDLTNYPKNYDFNVDGSTYSFIQSISIKKSNNITLDGFVINDSQQLAVEVTDSQNININNLKIFSRVIWGDGIHMKGSRDININNCFIRTSDDGVSIYASRHTPLAWQIPYENNHALNISVQNTSFYSDGAHPIEIGWHGNCNSLNYYSEVPLPYIQGLDIYNITFNNIDILEHDQSWNLGEYDGAMSINCGEGNRCSNILFNNIRIEDFTKGRLFSVNVEDAGFGAALTKGKSVENVRFENITYNGTGESPSTIKGLWCEEFVDGVHFNNFYVNGLKIKSLNGVDSYKIGSVNGIESNNYAYNITFEEANRYITDLADDNYLIQNVQTGKYLQKTQRPNENFIINTVTNNTNTFPESQLWTFELKAGTGHYYIMNYSDSELLKNTNVQFIGEELAPNQWPYYCDARYLTTEIFTNSSTTQEWKIEKEALLSSNYKIHNAYTRAFLTQDIIQDYGIARPEILTVSNSPNLQKWLIKKLPENASISNAKISNINKKLGIISFSPNPCKDILQIDYPQVSPNTILKIVDMKGCIVYQNENKYNISNHDISKLNDGVYLLIIEKDLDVLLNEKIVKIN